MNRIFLLACIALLLAPVKGAMIFSGGTATTTCVWDRTTSPAPPQQEITLFAGGDAIDLTCPSNYFGPPVNGRAGALFANGRIGWGLFSGGTFSLGSMLIDSYVPAGDLGAAGLAQITLTYSWHNVADLGWGTASAKFVLNGRELWGETIYGCDMTYCGQTRQKVVTLQQPIVFGVPLGYEGTVEVSGSGRFIDMSSLLEIQVDVLTPEPGSAWLAGFPVIALLAYKRLRR